VSLSVYGFCSAPLLHTFLVEILLICPVWLSTRVFIPIGTMRNTVHMSSSLFFWSVLIENDQMVTHPGTQRIESWLDPRHYLFVMIMESSWQSWMLSNNDSVARTYGNCSSCNLQCPNQELWQNPQQRPIVSMKAHSSLLCFLLPRSGELWQAFPIFASDKGRRLMPMDSSCFSLVIVTKSTMGYFSIEDILFVRGWWCFDPNSFFSIL
jgi:hypothetical protein